MASATSIDIGTFITKSEEIRGGRPVIVGTGMMVRTIVNLHKQGAHPDEIAEWKYLTLAQVYAALAYYYANRQEIENDIDAYDSEYDTLEREWEQPHTEDRV
jgi:uncharacterized protein (DUF433 family)